MVRFSNPKQYQNNGKSDMSLFPVTNKERPYEQLLHNWTFTITDVFAFFSLFSRLPAIFVGHCFHFDGFSTVFDLTYLHTTCVRFFF